MAEWIINNGLFEAACLLMDEEIANEINLETETDTEFLEKYLERHYEKYRIEFIVM